jgi:MoaA/NifB/PqqE/SkfB family radical SAM enzyme
VASSKKNKIKKIDGVAVWFITDSCNYRCSYCFTRKSEIKVKDYKLFLNNIRKKIPQNWRFYIMGGGEPFTHPNFFEIIEGLVKSGYRLSIISNFSASQKKLNRFFEIAGKNLDFFNASLHLEHTKAQIFIKKIAALKKILPDFDRIHVSTVAKKGKTRETKFLKKLFSDKKIRLTFLRLKKIQKNKEFKDINYSPREINLFSFPAWSRSNPSLAGQPCGAGQKSIIIDPLGNTFRCVTSSNKKHGYLGNLLTGDLSFYAKPKPCEEKFCFCEDCYLTYKRVMKIYDIL